jgi:phosphoglycerate dehydrogenase-like enzyme
MQIYFIGIKETLGKVPHLLKDLGSVIHLEKGSDINSYTELIEDKSDKILVVAPNLLGWSIPNEYLKQVKNLKGIVTRSSWGHYLDIEFCNANGITVVNAPGANAQAVAEYAIWQMQSLIKQLPLQMKNDFSLMPELANLTEEVAGKTVGIVGMGRIGERIAEMCVGLGMKVQYWNRSKKDLPYKQTELADLLSTSDVIFKAYETSKETNDILNSANLKLIKPSSYFVSVFGGLGWGGEDDWILLDRTENQELAGFSVESEHKKGAKVKSEYKGNVFIPAGLAWYTKETQVRYDEIVADGVKGIIGGNPINVVA